MDRCRARGREHIVGMDPPGQLWFISAAIQECTTTIPLVELIL